MKFVVHLCTGCIESLKEHQPYTVPLEDIEVVETSKQECDNFGKNLANHKRVTRRNSEYLKQKASLK